MSVFIACCYDEENINPTSDASPILALAFSTEERVNMNTSQMIFTWLVKLFT